MAFVDEEDVRSFRLDAAVASSSAHAQTVAVHAQYRATDSGFSHSHIVNRYQCGPEYIGLAIRDRQYGVGNRVDTGIQAVAGQFNASGRKDADLG